MRVRTTMVSLVAAAALVGGLAPVAMAAGAGGGDFTCSMTGIPGWGTVRSQYKHPSKYHYATAIGSGRQTKYAAAGAVADAHVGRAGGGNACYWGF